MNLDRGLISLKFEGFFAKWPGKTRSGPSARPIRRPGFAGDMARSLARELARNRKEEIPENQTCVETKPLQLNV